MGRRILWIDQAEWYVVCEDCYEKHKDSMWSGFTTLCRGDYERFIKCWEKLKQEAWEYAKTVTHCELCGKPLNKQRG